MVIAGDLQRLEDPAQEQRSGQLDLIGWNGFAGAVQGHREPTPKDSQSTTIQAWVSWDVVRQTHSRLGEQIGMALSDRQAQMGHADVRMTLHYTHSDLERRRASVETMTGKLLGEASGSVN